MDVEEKSVLRPFSAEGHRAIKHKHLYLWEENIIHSQSLLEDELGNI